MDFKQLSPEEVDYAVLPPAQLVGLFALKAHRNRAVIALVGGLTDGELRRIVLSGEAFAALCDGLKHPNARVRWECLQLFDHVGDERAWPFVVAALDDPVEKVRKHARHALECERCKLSPELATSARAAIAARSLADASPIGPEKS